MTVTTPLVNTTPVRRYIEPAPDGDGMVKLPGGAWIEEDCVQDFATLGPRAERGKEFLEDLDPTPVPTGCPRCWEGPGAQQGRCTRCPLTRAR